MADTGGPSRDSGLDARVARLETDVAEIKSALNRLAPRIDEMYGSLNAKLPELATKAEIGEIRARLPELATKSEIIEIRAKLPELATKAELADLRTELKSEMAELRIEILQRPTRRQAVFDIFAIAGLIGVILTIAAHFAH
jgi:chromosome segregation ATPase